MSAHHILGLVGPKGSAVRRLKWYVSWVQNVVRQFGPYPSQAARNLEGAAPSTRGTGVDGPLVYQLSCQGSVG